MCYVNGAKFCQSLSTSGSPRIDNVRCALHRGIPPKPCTHAPKTVLDLPAVLLIASRVADFVMCLTFALCVVCMTSAKLVARVTSLWRSAGEI
jgi:hypothetical protein